MITHLLDTPLVAYTGFMNTIFITFTVGGHLELDKDRADLQKLLAVINPDFLSARMYVPLFPNKYKKLQLKEEYSIKSQSIFTTIENTFPWLGMGHWIRMIQVPGCSIEAVTVQPLQPVHILDSCGELKMTSTTGHAKLAIPESLFSVYQGTFDSNEVNEFLSIAFLLREAEQAPDYMAKGLFNVELQWTSRDDKRLQKRMVYTRRRYLEIQIFSEYPCQEFSIELEWDNSLGPLEFFYLQRIPIAKQHATDELIFDTSWIRDKQTEVCFKETSSCYRYQEGSQVTWNIAQAHCAEHSYNLVSINSPEEWHSLLRWAYNFHSTQRGWQAYISAIGVFKGLLLFIGQQRKDVRKSVFFCCMTLLKA